MGQPISAVEWVAITRDNQGVYTPVGPPAHAPEVQECVCACSVFFWLRISRRADRFVRALLPGQARKGAPSRICPKVKLTIRGN